MKFLGLFILLAAVWGINAEEPVIVVGGVAFTGPVLTAVDGENLKITSMYGEKTVRYQDVEPITISTVDGRVYRNHRLEKIDSEQIMLGKDGFSVRIKADKLPAEYKYLFGFSQSKAPVGRKVESTKTSTAKSEFYLAGEALLSKLRRARENYTPSPFSSAKRKYQNIIPNIIFFKSDSGAGSGFICNLYGIPVIVTNAHVYVTMENPKIHDGQSNQYKPKAALIAQDRDIAILEVDIPEGIVPLELDYQVASLALNTKLSAYGNSLGDEVATEQKGILQGIGPSRIEVNAGIVPGNSGGPIITNNRVVGVATSLRMLEDSIWYDDTRFRQKVKSYAHGKLIEIVPAIRRFATRIDNLNFNEMGIYDPEEQQAELKIYRDLTKARRLFSKEFLDWVFNPEKHADLQLEGDFNRIFEPFGYLYSYTSPVKFIQTLLKDEMLVIYSSAARLALSINYASNSDKKNALAVYRQISKYRKSNFTCQHCNGRGKAPNTQSRIDRGNISPQLIRCQLCEGAGSVSKTFYELPRGYSPGGITYGALTYGGLQLGWTAATASTALRNEDECTTMEFAGILKAISFERNPILLNAGQTKTAYIVDRLTEITLEFDYSTSITHEVINSLEQMFGEPIVKIIDNNFYNFDYVVFKKDQFTANVLWADSSYRPGQKLYVRIYHDTLYSLKQLLLNDIGNTPYSKQKLSRIQQQQKENETGRKATGGAYAPINQPSSRRK